MVSVALVYEGENDIVKNQISVVLLVLGAGIMAFVFIFSVVYTVYVCIFFQYSMLRFSVSNEYARIIKQYDSIQKIKGYDKKRIKRLYRMRFINKELYNVAIEAKKGK
jgi:hypothetical protein